MRDTFASRPRIPALVSCLFSSKRGSVKVEGIIAAVRSAPVGVEEASWAKAYERRMRRFNVEVVVLALGTLPILSRLDLGRVVGFFKIAFLTPDFHSVQRYPGLHD